MSGEEEEEEESLPATNCFNMLTGNNNKSQIFCRLKRIANNLKGEMSHYNFKFSSHYDSALLCSMS